MIANKVSEYCGTFEFLKINENTERDANSLN